MTKKLIGFVGLISTAAFGLAACGVTTDGTYTGANDGVQYTLVLDTSDSSANFTAEQDTNTVELIGTLNADDEQITWNSANTNFNSNILDGVNDFFSGTSIGSDFSSDLEGTTSTYDRDGDSLTLNFDGDTIALERIDD